MASVVALSAAAPLISVFEGQGPQHIPMGKGLFRACRTFRQTVLEMDTIMYVSLVCLRWNLPVSSANRSSGFLKG